MNNLTDSEIARIFAMYLPKDILREDYEDLSDNLILDQVESINIGYNYIETKKYRPLINTCKLLLTPLSKITDEHAIEIAKIYKNDYCWGIEERGADLVLLNCNDYRMFIYTKSICEFIDVEEFYGAVIDDSSSDWKTSTFDTVIDAIDKLRELGYALPYKSKSLFELGIAIDKTTLK